MASFRPFQASSGLVWIITDDWFSQGLGRYLIEEKKQPE